MLPDTQGGIVTDKQNNQLVEIEATQKALRDSIEATTGLAEKAEKLLQKHRQTLEKEQRSG